MEVVADVCQAYDVEMNQDVFGDALKRARTARGLTQRGLADELQEIGLSVDQASIARMEAGKREPRLSEALAIAAHLDIDIGALGGQEVELMTRLRTAIAEIAEHTAMIVAEEMRRDSMLAEVERILREAPELEFDLSERDRERLRRAREPF